MMNTRATLCPNDNKEMGEVRIDSHYGQPVFLEQCPACGGIWFDRSELYMARQGEASRIDMLNANALRTPSVIENPVLVCPKDHARLAPFKDPYFPAELMIIRCPVCNGLWLNRGEFAKYQKFRQTRLHPKEATLEDKTFQDNIEQVLMDHRAGASTEGIANLGRFLSTPLDVNTLRPLEDSQRSPEEERAVNAIIDTLMAVLGSLWLR